MVIQVRAEVFHTLEGPPEGILPTPLSNENLLINELVRDYLSYNGYVNALGVFMTESGQPSDRSLDRGFIRDEVGTILNRARLALIAPQGLSSSALGAGASYRYDLTKRHTGVDGLLSFWPRCRQGFLNTR